MNVKSVKEDKLAEYLEKLDEADEKDNASKLRKYFRDNWTWWDEITAPFCRFRLCVRDKYYNLKYRCQRFTRGYSDEDVFEFAFNLQEHLVKILRDFIECHHGYSGDSEEEYDQKLKDMLFHLENMDEFKISAELDKKYSGYCKEYFEEQHNIMEHHTDEFFKLFRELFWTLWD